MAKDAILNPLVVGDWVAVGNGRISSVRPRIEKIDNIVGDKIRVGNDCYVNSFRAVNIMHLLCADFGRKDAKYKDLIGAEITEDDYLAVAFTGVYKPRWFGAKLDDGFYTLVWIGDSHCEGVFDDSGKYYRRLNHVDGYCLRITDVAQKIVIDTIDRGIENYDSKRRK